MVVGGEGVGGGGGGAEGLSCPYYERSRYLLFLLLLLVLLVNRVVFSLFVCSMYCRKLKSTKLFWVVLNAFLKIINSYHNYLFHDD